MTVYTWIGAAYIASTAALVAACLIAAARERLRARRAARRVAARREQVRRNLLDRIKQARDVDLWEQEMRQVDNDV